MEIKNKNIWIINQYAGSSNHGMTFRSYFLAKEFIKRHRVTIFSASFSHVMSNPPSVSKTYTEENINGVEYLWLKVPVYKQSKSLSRLISMFIFLYRLFFLNVKKRDTPDVIIVSSTSPLPIWKAYFWAKRFNAKLIFEVRDIWPLSIMELGGFKKTNPFVVLLQITENFAYKVSDYVVSVLPKAFEHMKHHGLDLPRFKYIPNGIEIKTMIKTDEVNKDVFKIGYAGTLGIANALKYLIHAAHLIKESNIEIHLLGNGPEKETLMEMVKDKNISNVYFHDAVPKNKVGIFLSKMDALFIGWHFSKIYRFGISANKLFDYLASAKPIIHSVDAGNDPVLEAKAGISVKPENPKEIADAILKLYKMPESKRNELGQNGRVYVEKYHSYEQLAKQYEYLFN
ncbi:MAG: glycosyltransferase family 4 protein [Flavobacteriales bacterium]